MTCSATPNNNSWLYIVVTTQVILQHTKIIAGDLAAVQKPVRAAGRWH
jgi:hypothetical protein